MKIIVSTHQGQMYNEEVDYVVCKSHTGEFAVMKGHTPVVSVIVDGYIKLVRGDIQMFVVCSNAVFEFNNEVVTVLAREAHIGKDVDNARELLIKVRNERLNLNKKEESDFTQKQSELNEHLKKAHAGSL